MLRHDRWLSGAIAYAFAGALIVMIVAHGASAPFTGVAETLAHYGAHIVLLILAVAFAARAAQAGTRAADDRRHRRMIERSREVIFETDVKGRWTYLNPAWTLVTGTDAAGEIGQSFLRIIAAEDRGLALARIAPLYAREIDQCHQELRYRHGDGTQRWASVRSHLLTDVRGRVVGTYGTLHDITTRKQAQAARADSEHLYQLLAENCSDMIVRLGLDGVRSYVSPASRSLLGYEPEEMIGHTPAGEIHPDDRNVTIAACYSLLHGGPEATATYRQRHKQGHYVPLEATYRLIRDPDTGDAAGVVCSVRDGSRRADAEKNASRIAAGLRESHRLLLMAETVGGIGHWRLDVASEAVVWSDAVCAMHGRPAGFSPALATAIHSYHPDDRERVGGLVGGALATGGDFDFGARIVRTDGGLRHVVSRGRAEIAPDGSVIGLFGVIQDTTDQVEAQAQLRESEARFRLITDQASDMISLQDADDRFVFMSPSARTILGYDAADMIGRQPRDFAPGEEHAQIEAHRERLAELPDGEVVSMRFPLRRADGSIGWMEIASRLAPYRGETCTVSVWRDVTAQIAAEAELREARKAAEAAAAAQATFLATMSHEVRTPMTGVLGMLDLLRADPRPEQRDLFFDTLEQSTKSLMTVLDDVLDYSKIDAGTLTLESVEFDLGTTARGVVDLFSGAASAKGVLLAADVPAGGAAVRGDPTRIRQVLSNLIGNAVKFTGEGRIDVTLSGAPVGDGHTRWRLCVADTGIGIGIGIDQADAEHLFAPFVQADESTTRRFGGTGLGLTISKRLVSAMGGEIGAEPRPEGGAMFWCELILPDGVAAAAAAPAADAGPVQPAASGKRLRVLVVEDNRVNQLLLHALLERLGHGITCVGDGRSAVVEVGGGDYDLVLMDMQMPVMDGVAATRAIRALEGPVAAIPIVALTADALPERRRFYDAIGLTDFLTKPIDVPRLEAMLAGIEPFRSDAAQTDLAQTDPAQADAFQAGAFQAGGTPTDALQTEDARAPIDPVRLDELRGQLGEAMLQSLIAMIGREAASEPIAIREALRRGEVQEAHQVAHALRGAAANMGATDLAD
ncbi:MAG TPA: PAS domain S-box protein, partial [Sphingomonas sp.]|nr:PAS domain S-box protein [Sphingomonas sp.]